MKLDIRVLWEHGYDAYRRIYGRIPDPEEWRAVFDRARTEGVELVLADGSPTEFGRARGVQHSPMMVRAADVATRAGLRGSGDFVDTLAETYARIHQKIATACAVPPAMLGIEDTDPREAPASVHSGLVVQHSQRLAYEYGTPVCVTISCYDPTWSDSVWATREFEHTMATDADSTAIALVDLINARMPHPTVVATHPIADTITLTSELAGVPFKVSYEFGAQPSEIFEERLPPDPAGKRDVCDVLGGARVVAFGTWSEGDVSACLSQFGEVEFLGSEIGRYENDCLASGWLVKRGPLFDARVEHVGGRGWSVWLYGTETSEKLPLRYESPSAAMTAALALWRAWVAESDPEAPQPRQEATALRLLRARAVPTRYLGTADVSKTP